MAKTNDLAAGLDQAKSWAKNYIINGAMMISQENGTTAGTALSYYPVDQFYGYNATGGTVSFQQVASVTPAGSSYRLRASVTVADTSIGASEYTFIAHPIEGTHVADLLIGNANARRVTLQFGVKAPAGTYSVVFRNGSANRAYVAEYTISALEANTDVYKTVTAVMDTTGTWSNTSGLGLMVFWCLAAGSSFVAAPGSWGAGNIVGSTNQFNFVGTVSNTFELFDVGLYKGRKAPDFELPDYTTELARCQRYWTQTYINSGGQATTSGISFASTAFWPTTMRVAPTLSLVAGTRTNVSSASLDGSTIYGCRHLTVSAGTGAFAATSEIITASSRM